MLFTYSSLTPEIACFLKTHGIPFVACNACPDIPGVNWVDFDNESSLAEVLEYLLKLGHRHIGYEDLSIARYRLVERMYGVFEEVLGRAGCFNPDYFYVKDNMEELYARYNEDCLNEHARRGLKYFLSLARRPTAVIFCQEKTAMTFERELPGYGIAVPKDFSIITSTPVSRAGHFTAVTYNIKKCFSLGIARLLEMLTNPDNEIKTRLIKKSLRRGSTTDRAPSSK
jgi:LacI family transcriptional regulator